MIYGYARVSREDQNLEMQIDALESANVDQVFTDVVSGIVYTRPELKKLIDVLQEGDTIVVWKFDRLSRSIKDLIFLLDLIQKKGAKWVSISEGLDSSKPMDKMMINLVGILAENERDNIIQRTLCGLENAKRKGVVLGRPKSLSEKQIEFVRKSYFNKEMTMKEIAKFFKLSYSTIRRVISKNNDSKFANI